MKTTRECGHIETLNIAINIELSSIYVIVK